MERGAKALVPLADQCSGIAGWVEGIGDRALVQRQAKFGFVPDVRIELVAEMRLVSPGEKPGTSGAAIGAGHIAAGATDAGSRQGVDVRGRYDLAAVHADVDVAQIIR